VSPAVDRTVCDAAGGHVQRRHRTLQAERRRRQQAIEQSSKWRQLVAYVEEYRKATGSVNNIRIQMASYANAMVVIAISERKARARRAVLGYGATRMKPIAALGCNAACAESCRHGPGHNASGFQRDSRSQADPAAARLEIYTNVGDLTQAALDALGDWAAQKDIREAVAAQSPRIIDELLWSGRPGALIHVRMQETMPSPNVTPAAFIPRRGIRRHGHLCDERARRRPRWRAPHGALGSGGQHAVSPTASFYLWASLAVAARAAAVGHRSRALYLNRAAVEQAANRDLSAAARQSRELELLAALAQRAKELEASQPLRESIEQSLQRLEASAQSRRRDRDEAQRSAGVGACRERRARVAGCCDQDFRRGATGDAGRRDARSVDARSTCAPAQEGGDGAGRGRFAACGG